MFKNPDDIPDESPIKKIDMESTNEQLKNLKDKKQSIINEIEKILRK